MTTLARFHQLVRRGAAGLACDDDGVALGSMPLVESTADASGCRRYRLRPAAEVAQVLRLAYGFGPDEIERTRRGLARAVQQFNAGNSAQARIEALLLALPEIPPEAVAKLARAAALRKSNPDVADEPRLPSGGPGGGEWTSDGDAGEGDASGDEPTTTSSPVPRKGDPDIRPAAALMSPVQEMKGRFVDAHLADTQKAADQLGIPVENILGLAALESGWGEHPFAASGNNYFGIHYPAPYATGYVRAGKGTAKVATFASYADSLKSFVLLSGSVIKGKSDPTAFAAALQNSGKFGVYENGAKVPTYVPGLAGTIRGLRAIVARRKI